MSITLRSSAGTPVSQINFDSQDRKFKLTVHQVLYLDVDFKHVALKGHTELVLQPLVANLQSVHINSRQCYIERVTVNGVDAGFALAREAFDTLVPPSLDSGQRDAQTLKEAYMRAGLADKAELAINIPNNIPEKTDTDGSPQLHIKVKFSLRDPKGGVYFVMPTGTAAQHGNEARLWFPCIDNYAERCHWSLCFVVPQNMVAVSSGRLLSQDLYKDRGQRKFLYRVSVPTPACDIGLCVGPFEAIVDSNFSLMTHYCLPGLTEQVTHTTAFMGAAFEFFNDYLGVKFPYTSYQQVFVDDPYQQAASYSSISIFGQHVLHSKSIIDQTVPTRRELAFAAASQWFGHYLGQKKLVDTWLVVGLAGYLANQFMARHLGHNENRHYLMELMEYVCTEEEKERPPLFNDRFNHPSELYSDFVKAKSLLVMRMIEKRIGDENFQRVLNSMLGIAASWKRTKPDYSPLLVSTNGFLKLVKKASGQDLKAFAETWIHNRGCVQFNCSFNFNRKRSLIEFSVEQTPIGLPKDHKFLFRRAKRKKIRLHSGEEMEVEFSDRGDTPILYMMVDPEGLWIRRVVLQQPDYMWAYQLQIERDAAAAHQAALALLDHGSIYTHNSLVETIESKEVFYRVRMAAAYTLAKLNEDPGDGKPEAEGGRLPYCPYKSLLALYRKHFYHHYEHSEMVRPNDFLNLKDYYVQKTIPRALAGVRDSKGLCPVEVVEFLVHLLEYNDNDYNLWSDCHYVSSLFDSLADALRYKRVESDIVVDDTDPMEYISARLQQRILDTAVRYLNVDRMLPSYHSLVSVSALRLLLVLSDNGKLDPDTLQALAQDYFGYGHYRGLRLQALRCLVGLVEKVGTGCMDQTVACVEGDVDHGMRLMALEELSQMAAYRGYAKTSSKAYDHVQFLWSMINDGARYDVHLRLAMLTLYEDLYGLTQPQPVIAKRRAPQEMKLQLTMPARPIVKLSRQPSLPSPASRATVEADQDMEEVVEAKTTLKLTLVTSEPKIHDPLPEQIEMQGSMLKIRLGGMSAPTPPIQSEPQNTFEPMDTGSPEVVVDSGEEEREMEGGRTEAASPANVETETVPQRVGLVFKPMEKVKEKDKDRSRDRDRDRSEKKKKKHKKHKHKHKHKEKDRDRDAVREDPETSD